MVNKYQCNNQPFYQEWIVDGNGNFSVMFACQDIIDAVVNQGATELHADGTFKVVPSVPTCRQLFIIHLILQNHVRNISYYSLFYIDIPTNYVYHRHILL